MTDTRTLLAEYARNGSGDAFRGLVESYINLVYSTAFRLVGGDAHLAEDVTQMVFANLARKACALGLDVSLGGWLHRHTCFVATNTLRGERRRQTREQEAVEMKALQDHPEPDYTQVAPMLDEAINQLGEDDRTAIMLRFFEQRDFRSVGEALDSNEDAARVRVGRALDKLRTRLQRQGIATSAGALSVVLGTHAVHAAPAGLALTASHAALAAASTLLPAKAVALTALHKALIAGGLTMLIGTGIYLARQPQGRSSPIAAAAANPTSRPPSLEEMRQLFRLAIVDQPRIRIKADMTVFEKPWTPRQIADEMVKQKQMLQADGVESDAKWEITQSNAIVRSHSGSRIYHVQEWYSTNHHYRLDQTDEGRETPESLLRIPGKYAQTYVNIDDPAFSIYRSFHEVHTLRDAELNRTNIYGRNDLWVAAGLEYQVGTPVVIALLDAKSLPKTNFQTVTSYEQIGAKIDAASLESLHDGTNRFWQMVANQDTINGAVCTRIKLTPTASGRNIMLHFSDLEFNYWLNHMGSNTLCIQAIMTNLITHDSYVTTRSEFDENGYPRIWKRTTIAAGKVEKRVEVAFSEIDLQPTFTDQEVFAPVFPTNYLVYDITSGTEVVLQKPAPPRPTPRSATPR